MTPSYFFIAGAQRSGTTFLYRLLEQHPEIEMARPLRPEPKFFLDENVVSAGLGDYERFFGHKPNARARGEKSTSYIEYPCVAARIRCLLPGAKIIFVLRDPVSRAISNYWFSFNNGLERATMAEAFFKENDRVGSHDHARTSVSPFAYLRRGNYYHYLRRYLEHVPAGDVKILLFERMITEERETAELFRFLGVAPDFVPRRSGPVNASQPDGAGPPPELLRYLSGYFAESNRKLSRAFDLDLSCWMNAT